MGRKKQSATKVRGDFPDEKDREIIRALQENARITDKELASLVKLSRQAVAPRVERLVQEKVVQRFTVDVDWPRLGYTLPVLIFVRHKHRHVDRFNELMEIAVEREEVKDVFAPSGSAGFAIFGVWKDAEHYARWKTWFIARAEEKGHEIYEMEEIVIWSWRKRGGRKVGKPAAEAAGPGKAGAPATT